LRSIINNYWIKNVLLPVLLIVPIVWFSVPSIPHGTDNLRMIMHFDKDEGGLIEFTGKIYSKGLIPLESNAFTYPQLFYYLGGTVLFPYTAFSGINYQGISIVLRCMNTLAIMLTVVFVYFFVLRFFRSIYAAALSGIMLATMPQMLWWTVNSRPHPLEILFILIVIYFCFRIVEKYELKLLIGAIVFAALAASTKFGGFFLIPTIWMACFFNIFKMKTIDLIKYIKEKSMIIYMLASAIIFIVIFSYLLLITIFYKLHDYFVSRGLYSLGDIGQIRDVRLVMAVSVIILFFGLIWLIINLFSNKLLNKDEDKEKTHFILAINKGILVSIGVFVGVFSLFVILNPSYWLFPQATLKVTAVQVAQTTMGVNYDPGMGQPIINSGWMAWFALIFDNQILNIPFGILLILYFIYEIFMFKESWGSSRTALFQRIMLWVYLGTLFLFLSLVVSHRAHHYLLPIGFVLTLLIPVGMIEIVRKIKQLSVRTIVICFFCVMVILGIYMRSNVLIEMRDIKMGKNDFTDAGLVLGKYLDNKYTAENVICIDDVETFVPVKFRHVIVLDLCDKSMFIKLKKMKPDMFILTYPSVKTQLLKLSKRGEMPRYVMVKRVVRKRPLADLTVFYRTK